LLIPERFQTPPWENVAFVICVTFFRSEKLGGGSANGAAGAL